MEQATQTGFWLQQARGAEALMLEGRESPLFPKSHLQRLGSLFGKLQITPRLEGATSLIRYRNHPRNAPVDKHRDSDGGKTLNCYKDEH